MMSLFFIPEENEFDPFPDLTEDFYSFLEIPEEEVFKGSKDERVKQILIIISGIMGIGKTKLVENIIQRLKDYWESKGREVNAVISRVSMSALIENAFRGNPRRGWDAKKAVQILAYDDATGARLTLEQQREFCALRHKMIEETGLKEGIIYSILVTHDWYRLDPNFRRNALITIFLSAPPLDRYSKREYVKFIGRIGVDYLIQKTADAIRFDEKKGEGLVVLPFTPLLSSEEERVGRIKWTDKVKVKYILIKRHPRISSVLVFKMKEVENA
jgi:hypothetical protein